MTILHVETGMTVSEVRNTILKSIRAGEVHQIEMDELFSIFFTDDEVWARQEHLLRRIKDTYDPIRLEEAARVVINPMMYYVYGDGKYYVYGG